MLTKKDCFAYNGSKCAATTRRRCEGCTMYRTRGEYERAAAAAKAHVHTLPQAEQRYYRDKYKQELEERDI